MELNEMTLNDVESRIAELDTEGKSTEEIEAMTEELKALNERKAELADLEARKKVAEAINEGKVAAAEVKTIEERKGEPEMMTVKEYRNSEEYINAFAEYVKTGKDEECRALLTTNVGEAGTIAVPDFVYDEIKTAWDNNDILNSVRRVEVKGNMKVQFEISGTDAVIHNEGSGAVTEETLVLGIVTLIPESIKKWISISDEALDLRGQAFLDYIFAELGQKIIKKAADTLIAKIKELPQSATATSPMAAAVTAAPAVGTVASAIGQLSDEASNPVVIMNKATWAAFKAAQYAAGYSIDPFEGLQVKFSSELPAYSTATAGQVYAIVGDLGFGALANFPNGFSVAYKVDDKTAMTEDLVKVLGRMYCAVEPVACKAFTLVKKPESL